MKLHRSFIRTILVAGIGLVLGIAGREAARGANRIPQKDDAIRDTALVTLYAHDPFSCTYSFARDGGGMVIQGYRGVNEDSQIAFDVYHPGEFTVGIQGSDVGAIVDLGTPEAMAERFGYQERMGHGQGFASLQRKEGRIHVLADSEKYTTQPVPEADCLFRDLRGSNHVPVKAGHVYMMRLADSSRDGWELLLVKFLVVAFTPGESVTLRWIDVEL